MPTDRPPASTALPEPADGDLVIVRASIAPDGRLGAGTDAAFAVIE